MLGGEETWEFWAGGCWGCEVWVRSVMLLWEVSLVTFLSDWFSRPPPSRPAGVCHTPPASLSQSYWVGRCRLG